MNILYRLSMGKVLNKEQKQVYDSLKGKVSFKKLSELLKLKGTVDDLETKISDM